MKVTLGLALAILPFFAFAEDDGEAVKTQAGMTAEAAANFEKADAELNKVYRDLKTTLDEEAAAKLKTAQKAWLAYRDAEAALEAASFEGGSIHAMTVTAVKTRLTESRTAELRNLLASDNEEAGEDVPRDASGNPYGHGYNPEGTDDPSM